MRIAVLADTHNRLPSAVRADLSTADEIWHLGDICSADILKELRGLGPPVHAIGGNCDPRGLAPATLTLTRTGHTFYLVHEPPHTVPAGAGFALHGHTHVPRDETIAGVRFLNPGTVGKPNHGARASFAWLDLEPGATPSWTIVPAR
jgi:putative phosphoesterase